MTSELGLGSAFKLRLFLPRINDAKRPAIDHRIIDPLVGLGRTILVVDDDPMHRDMIHEALSSHAFELLFARDGTEGLAIAAGTKPDLFLLDIELPDMDGWHLAEHLRDQGHTDSKIVMLSASAREEYRSAIALPFHDAFIMKPVDIALLMKTIVGLLNLHTKEDKTPAVTPRAPIIVTDLERPSEARVQDLIRLCEIGYLRGLRETLADITEKDPAHEAFASHMLAYVEAVDLRGLMASLERVSEPAS